MPKSHRIEKKQMHVGQKKGRGRPREYSSAWTKKLVVLSLCGVHVSDIIQILNLQETSSFKAKLRRAQQLVRQILANGDGRFCPPTKSTARKRAAFIRASGRSNRTQKRQLANRLSYRNSGCLKGTDHLHDDVGSTMDRRPSVIPLAYSPMTREPSIDKSILYERSMGLEARDMPDGKVSNDTPDETTSDRISMIRDVFERTSLSSSMVSDLMSILDHRFSSSTLSSSMSGSSSATSMVRKRGLWRRRRKSTDYIDTLSNILKIHAERMTDANTAMIRECCSNTSYCGHKYITTLILENISIQPPTDMWPFKFIPDPDTLFFAARSGAPAEILLHALEDKMIANRKNIHGQTFLFQLDPQGLKNSTCTCYGVQQHSSRFECLICHLENLDFDFDRRDVNGRHFLFLLCASPSFDISWLLSLTSKYSRWMDRVRWVTWMRDPTGLSLIHYMARNPGFQALHGGLQTLFPKPYAIMTDSSEGPPYCSDDRSTWATRIPRYLKHYDVEGNTPMMAYLKRAFQEALDESLICTRVQRFLDHGADVNARALDMSTILHFAAGNAMPALVEKLLAAGVQVEHRDDKGLTALDYAARAYNRSVSNKMSPQLTARSLQTATKLLHVVKPATSLSAGSKRSNSRNRQYRETTDSSGSHKDRV